MSRNWTSWILSGESTSSSLGRDDGSFEHFLHQISAVNASFRSQNANSGVLPPPPNTYVSKRKKQTKKHTGKRLVSSQISEVSFAPAEERRVFFPRRLSRRRFSSPIASRSTVFYKLERDRTLEFDSSCPLWTEFETGVENPTELSTEVCAISAKKDAGARARRRPGWSRCRPSSSLRATVAPLRNREEDSEKEGNTLFVCVSSFEKGPNIITLLFLKVRFKAVSFCVFSAYVMVKCLSSSSIQPTVCRKLAT